jgi:hypothetical protein
MGRKIALQFDEFFFFGFGERDPTHTLMELEALPGWKEHT